MLRRTPRATAVVLALMASLAACGPGAAPARVASPASSAGSSPADTLASPSGPTSSSGVPSPTGAPAFHATVRPISADLAAEMTGVSWRPGCPVPLADLRLVQLTYWGFDGTARTGELVAHAG